LICPNATFPEIDEITQCNPSEHNLSDGIYFFNESGTSTIETVTSASGPSFLPQGLIREQFLSSTTS
jgi:hypothetical protein